MTEPATQPVCTSKQQDRYAVADIIRVHTHWLKDLNAAAAYCHDISILKLSASCLLQMADVRTTGTQSIQWQCNWSHA